MRHSPSLAIIACLRERWAMLRAFVPSVRGSDPTVRSGRLADPRLEGITIAADAYAACDGADAVALLTEWDEFRWLDFDKVRGLLSAPVIVDARNLLDPAPLRRRGFAYV